MYRLITYPIACVVVAALLALIVFDASGSLFLALAVAADITAVVVTWLVARREGRHALPWAILSVFIGPFAWILMVARRPAEPVSS